MDIADLPETIPPDVVALLGTSGCMIVSVPWDHEAGPRLHALGFTPSFEHEGERMGEQDWILRRTPPGVRRFHLYRVEDVSGVSGTGRVANGALFPDGTSVLRWCSEHRSTAVYSCLRDLIKIHGHNGATRLRFDDLS